MAVAPCQKVSINKHPLILWDYQISWQGDDEQIQLFFGKLNMIGFDISIPLENAAGAIFTFERRQTKVGKRLHASL